VQVATIARKDDAGGRSLRAVLKSGATTANGATRVLGTSYAVHEDRFEVNPATGAVWTKAGVDALQAGVEVVACQSDGSVRLLSRRCCSWRRRPA
jgi:hypothetical protein